jgi:hypothetical protein
MSVGDLTIIRADVIGDFREASTLVNSYQYQVNTATPIDEADLLDDVKDLFQALYTIIKGLTNVYTVWRRVRVSNVTTGEVYGEVDFSTPISGTASGDTSPAGVCALIYGRTSQPRVQLRKYLGVLAEVLTDNNGTLGSAARTILTNTAAFLVTDYTGTYASYSYGFLSPKTGTFLKPSSIAFSEEPAYQRRRKQGRGI